MSNLLFDSHPIVISQELAGALTGLDKRKYPRISEAAILQQIHYWLQKKQNFHDGRYWVYNSLEDWMKQFKWIKTKATMKRQFDWLENLGIIVTGNYNKMKFDRTKWYSIDYERLEALTYAFYQDDNTEVIKIDTPMLSRQSQGCYQDDNDNTIDYPKTTTKNTKDILSDKSDSVPYGEVVDYLNTKTDKNYRATSKKTRSLIKARFNEGFTLDDFKKVIDNKVSSWGKDKKMVNYLRPETLFGTKFESYLNERGAQRYDYERYTNGIEF